jgi:uncharacterized damage-inducible protein DinB
MKRVAIDLVEYHCWATKKMLDYLQTLPRNILTMQIKSVFSNVESVLVHMLAVDELWFERMKESGQEHAGEKIGWPVKQFILAYDRLLTDLRNFVHNIEDVNKIVSYKNSKGEKWSNTIFEIIQHIINHGTYHRGNITAMLHQAGYRSISTDFIYFLREK